MAKDAVKKKLMELKKYLLEVWAEVNPQKGKVSWPGKNEILSSTMVVLLSIVLVGIYIGVVDFAIQYALKMLIFK